LVGGVGGALASYSHLILEQLGIIDPDDNMYSPGWIDSIFVQQAWAEFRRDFLNRYYDPDELVDFDVPLKSDVVNGVIVDMTTLSLALDSHDYHDKDDWDEFDHCKHFVVTILLDGPSPELQTWTYVELREDPKKIVEALFELLNFLFLSDRVPMMD
jgi:hypothetical protein